MILMGFIRALLFIGSWVAGGFGTGLFLRFRRGYIQAVIMVPSPRRYSRFFISLSLQDFLDERSTKY